MRFFSLLDLQYEAMAVLLGLVTVLLLYLAWSDYPGRRPPELDQSKDTGEGEAEQETDHNPIGSFLIFLYIGIPLWSVAYMIYTGFFGPRF